MSKLTFFGWLIHKDNRMWIVLMTITLVILSQPWIGPKNQSLTALPQAVYSVK